MDVSVNAKVQCIDGPCGRLTYVVVNPITDRVTHVVVREDRFPHSEYVVDIEAVLEATPQTIRLRYTKDKLHQAEPFIITEYVKGNMTHGPDGGAPYVGMPYLMWPYVVPEEMGELPIEHEQIPPGELAVRRGTHVEAVDGRVGQVDEFLVNPANGHITHLVMREGHLWGQKDVTIPVSEIEDIRENVVYLKLTKREIGALPAVSIRR
jgi:sporulation protein YlmC with PRC-barrel domain